MLIADLENEKFKLIEFCLFDYNFTPKILDTNQIHVLGKNDDDNLQSIVLDESGAILVNKLHKVESEKDVRIAPYVYTNSDRVNNHFYSIGVLQFFYTQQEIQSYVGVFQFDENYNIINATYINEDLAFNFIELDRGYSLKIFGDFIYAICETPSLNQEGLYDLLLIKFDLNLNPIWEKRIYADHFSLNSSQLLLNDEGIKIVYNSFGVFPTVLLDLNFDGEIITQKGFPHYTPIVHLLNNSSLLFSSNYIIRDDDLIFSTYLVKTDSEGNQAQCDNFNSCLMSRDETLNYKSIDFINEDTMIDVSVYSLESFNVSFKGEQDCFQPTIPNAEFIASDTVCIGEVFEVVGLNNKFANGRDWEIKGNDLDSLVLDSLSLNLYLSKSGNYEITHNIWYLGCSHSFKKRIHVLEELEVDFEKKILCDEQDLLGLVANRDIKSYVWSNGQTNASIQPKTSAYYEVTVSDGYCEKVIEEYITYLSDMVDIESIIQLPKDTKVCKQFLPLELIIQNNLDATIYINDILLASESTQLYEEDQYRITAELEGCYFEEYYKLEIDSCEAQIYVPNIFSPNGDGINDVFEPLGINFEIINLEIYDKWGAKLHEGPSFWDGNNKDKEINPSVFFYVITYINTFTQSIEVISGNVTTIN